METSKKICQRHLTSLLAKQAAFTMSRLHATYAMTLNHQAYLVRLLSLDTNKLAGKDKILAKFLKCCAKVLDWFFLFFSSLQEE